MPEIGSFAVGDKIFVPEGDFETEWIGVEVVDQDGDDTRIRVLLTADVPGYVAGEVFTVLGDKTAHRELTVELLLERAAANRPAVEVPTATDDDHADLAGEDDDAEDPDDAGDPDDD